MQITGINNLSALCFSWNNNKIYPYLPRLINLIEANTKRSAVKRIAGQNRTHKAGQNLSNMYLDENILIEETQSIYTVIRRGAAPPKQSLVCVVKGRYTLEVHIDSYIKLIYLWIEKYQYEKSKQ